MIISVVFHCVGELDHTHNGIKSCIFRNLRYFKFLLFWDFPGGPLVKNPPCNAGDTSSQSLLQEDFTCHGAAKPVHNY